MTRTRQVKSPLALLGAITYTSNMSTAVGKSHRRNILHGNGTRRHGPRRNGQLTATKYMALPDDGKRYELIDGELMMSPSANYEHGEVILYVGGKLSDFVRDRNLGRVGIETDVVLSKDLVLRPDISFISKRRDSIIQGHVYGPPDLVVEVTSPGNWQMDVFAKRHDYESHGVREYWAIDIVDGRNRAYQWCLRGKVYQGGLATARTIRSRVLKGFTLKLDEVWESAGQ